MTAMIARPMRVEDVHEVADLHQAAFPKFFVAQLGKEFLYDFYSEVVRRHEPAHVALDSGGELAGFVVGSTAEGALFRSLAVRRFPSLALVALETLARSPRLFGRVVRAALKPTRSEDQSGSASLMYIAVGPTLRRHGAGRTLIATFVDDVSRRGAAKIKLVTLRDDNDAANDFYRALGFTLAGDTPSSDGWKNVYELSLKL